VELKLFMAMHDKIFYAYKTNCNMKWMNFHFMHYNYKNGDGL
jgi:hypothetical protein